MAKDTSTKHPVRPVSNGDGLKKYIFIIALLVFDSAIAANHFVRTDATGNNSGSDWANAYTSLPSALVRGDTYFLADGSYNGRVFSTSVNGLQLITIKKATPNDHGTEAGWQASYGDGQVLFTGGLEFTTPNWLLEGQTGGGAVNNWQGNFGFKISEADNGTAIIRVSKGANNITLRHIDFQGKGSVSTDGGSISNDALAIYGASDVTLSYFRMRGVGRCPFFISPQRLIVEHGWVESFFGSSAVHSEVASIWGFEGNVGDVTFRYNLFTDIQSTGGIMWDNSSNPNAKLFVYGNVFYKQPGANWGEANGVIGGWTGGNGEEFRNASVYNNTFINVDQESLSGFPNVFSNNTVYNNLFYNCQSPNFAKFSTHDNNHFINSGGTHGEASGTSASSGDPFVNLSGLDFRLKSSLGGGRTLDPAFAMDPLGVSRGRDGQWDRGAFEYGPKVLKSTPTLIRVN